MNATALSLSQGYAQPVSREASSPGVAASAQSPAQPATGGGEKSAPALAGARDMFVYQSVTERVSYAAQSAAVRTRGGEGADAASAEFRQLTFDFFAESRTEELAVFKQRTGAAAEGMGSDRAASFQAVSRRIEMRFSLSAEVSGAALQGFAKTAEGLPAASDKAFGDFMAFTSEALEKANEVMGKLLELMDGFFNGEGDFETRMRSLLDGLQSFGFDGGSAAPGQTQLQSAGFSVQMEFSFVSEQFTVNAQGVQESDPIVLDLDGDGIELTGYADGARFDILGNGRAVNTAFVTGGDAFLAIDRNGNGTIDSGKELFGDQNGARNGFEELRKLDSNGDGRIDRLDKEFDSLLLWKDNGNGITEEGELLTLEQAGIADISLGYRNVNQAAAGGNRITQIASFLRTDGTRGTAADAMLSYLA
jgi:hypothetical protein